jgi:hypothetical protein
MTDPSILAIRRELAFRKIAENLGVRSTVPSTKAPSLYIDSYMGEILVALVDRVMLLEGAMDALLEQLEDEEIAQDVEG